MTPLPHTFSHRSQSTTLRIMLPFRQHFCPQPKSSTTGTMNPSLWTLTIAMLHPSINSLMLLNVCLFMTTSIHGSYRGPSLMLVSIFPSPNLNSLRPTRTLWTTRTPTFVSSHTTEKVLASSLRIHSLATSFLSFPGDSTTLYSRINFVSMLGMPPSLATTLMRPTIVSENLRCRPSTPWRMLGGTAHGVPFVIRTFRTFLFAWLVSLIALVSNLNADKTSGLLCSPKVISEAWRVTVTSWPSASRLMRDGNDSWTISRFFSTVLVILYWPLSRKVYKECLYVVNEENRDILKPLFLGFPCSLSYDALVVTWADKRYSYLIRIYTVEISLSGWAILQGSTTKSMIIFTVAPYGTDQQTWTAESTARFTPRISNFRRRSVVTTPNNVSITNQFGFELCHRSRGSKWVDRPPQGFSTFNVTWNLA